MSEITSKELQEHNDPRERPQPPKNDEEWYAWDAYAAAALTGSLWWNQHKPVSADDPAKDAALIADEMLELRRRRKRGMR